MRRDDVRHLAGVEVLHRELRRVLVEGAADAEQLEHLVPVKVEPAGHRLSEPGAAIGHERATALVDPNEPERLERPDRLAHADAADAEGLDELSLRREPLAGREVAVLDRRLDLAADLLAPLGALDRPQRARRAAFPAVPSSGRPCPPGAVEDTVVAAFTGQLSYLL